MPQVVANRHLAAKTVPAIGRRHPVHFVGEGLDQYRNLQTRHADGVGHTPLLAKVGQGDQDAVYLVGPLLEQCRTLASILQCFDRTIERVLRAQDDGLDPFLEQHIQNLCPPGLAEVVGEEAPIADDDAQCSLVHLLLPPVCQGKGYCQPVARFPQFSSRRRWYLPGRPARGRGKSSWVLSLPCLADPPR